MLWLSKLGEAPDRPAARRARPPARARRRTTAGCRPGAARAVEDRPARGAHALQADAVVLGERADTRRPRSPADATAARRGSTNAATATASVTRRRRRKPSGASRGLASGTEGESTAGFYAREAGERHAASLAALPRAGRREQGEHEGRSQCGDARLRSTSSRTDVATGSLRRRQRQQHRYGDGLEQRGGKTSATLMTTLSIHSWRASKIDEHEDQAHREGVQPEDVPEKLSRK